ncbi:acyl-CoA dehydratase activase-related protein [Halothermothrix orenii]|uniref:Uncharacterized protein conserved in bacteria n=1 Tax=Halothermothrix orenii (strain H 168 / OCM 544 / DSM 9562) TaxID=373903 RepID=B8CVZ7_HALOH|nr:acyl-CoA dehydratase activase-related protein [Halothermothrix orenii]ACL69466.1 uncharacterized protein conserved in bacteria [Halothermothrix orenii H 168]
MGSKIGVPRALLYHYYYPAWEEFFNRLGFEIVLSKPTNKEILNRGVKLAVDDLCLPFKIYYGHVLDIKDRVDFLFIPRLIALGDKNKVCPKFMGLPDMVRATLDNLPPVLEPVIDLKRGIFSLRKVSHYIGTRLKTNYWKTERAFWTALNKYRKYIKLMEQGYTPDESRKIINGQKIDKNKSKKDRGIRVGVLGHSYIIHDNQLSLGLINNLQKMGVEVITPEMISNNDLERAAELQSKKLFWLFNRHIMGAAYHLLFNYEKDIDGIIQITAFGCGPDSLVKELVNLKGKNNKNVSLLNLNVDEHSGEAGLLTRIEAFIDLIERKKGKNG